MTEILNPKFWTREALPQYEIGEYSYGTPTVYKFDLNTHLKIGKFCSIAPEVTIILGGDHRYDWLTTYPFTPVSKQTGWNVNVPLYVASKGSVIIESDVWIGLGATILSGVTIHPGACIGARAVVTRDVPPYHIVAGNPARITRSRFSPNVIMALLAIAWWDWPIEKILANVDILMSPNIDRLLAMV